MPKSKSRAKQSKRLVIDASILRASGDSEAAHPTAKNCRDFLQEVLQICHRAVMTPEIGEEWKRHSSKFALKWKGSMVSRKKILRIPSATLPDLRAEICGADQPQTAREAAEKDAHLVEAAIATDRIITSLDDTARRAFLISRKAIGPMQWVNPTNEPDEVRQWLHDGAPATETYEL